MASDGNVGQGSKDNNKGTYLGKYIIFISIGQASVKTNVNKKLQQGRRSLRRGDRGNAWEPQHNDQEDRGTGTDTHKIVVSP